MKEVGVLIDIVGGRQVRACTAGKTVVPGQHLPYLNTSA